MTDNYHDLHNDVKTVTNMTNDEIMMLKNILEKPYVDVEGVFYMMLKDEMTKRGLQLWGNN